jgi:hypothetical protein
MIPSGVFLQFRNNLFPNAFCQRSVYFGQEAIMRKRMFRNRLGKSAFDVGEWNALVNQRIVQEPIIQAPDGNPVLYRQSGGHAGGLPHGDTILDWGQQVISHLIRGKTAPGNE